MDKRSLLVVDDEEPVRSVLRAWFAMRGFEVDVASDGGVAVQRCRERRYDAVILDRDMQPMGGLEVLPLLLDCQPDMPILILTGMRNDSAIFLRHGASRVCFKPIHLADLEKDVCIALASGPLPRALQSPAPAWINGAAAMECSVTARREDNPRISGACS